MDPTTLKAGTATAGHLAHAATNAPTGDVLLRRPAVQAATGYGRSAIYSLMKSGRFPQAVKLAGGGAVAWRASEIRAWIEAQGGA